MLYIRRDDMSGRVVAVSEQPLEGFRPLEGLADEEEAAVRELAAIQLTLAGTDIEFVRVIEDLVELLVAQHQIRFTDLPEVAQRKMLERQQLRHSFNQTLQLLPDDEDDVI